MWMDRRSALEKKCHRERKMAESVPTRTKDSALAYFCLVETRPAVAISPGSSKHHPARPAAQLVDGIRGFGHQVSLLSAFDFHNCDLFHVTIYKAAGFANVQCREKSIRTTIARKLCEMWFTTAGLICHSREQFIDLCIRFRIPSGYWV
jgi:hypothetical protein